jgi:hypothetical protein
MTVWLRQSQAGQSVLALAVGLALVLRIMIPPGFMPADTPQGMVIQLCSGIDIQIDLAGGKLPSDKHDAADRPCVFAAGIDHGALPVPLPAAMPLPAPTTAPMVAARPDQTCAPRLAAPPPPSHAPPALV